MSINEGAYPFRTLFNFTLNPHHHQPKAESLLFRLIRLSIWLCYKFAWIIDSMKQKKPRLSLPTISLSLSLLPQQQFFDEGWMEIFRFMALKNALNFESRIFFLFPSTLFLSPPLFVCWHLQDWVFYFFLLPFTLLTTQPLSHSQFCSCFPPPAAAEQKVQGDNLKKKNLFSI